MAVLLWNFPVEAQALDAGLFEPSLGNVQCEPPRGEDNSVTTGLDQDVGY